MTSQPNCPFCDKAEALLGLLDVEIEKTVLDTPQKKAAFKKAGFDTVPVIYINGYLVGGFSDLAEIAREQLGARFPA